MMIELGRMKRQAIMPICGDCKEVLVRGAVDGTMGRVWVPQLENSSYCLIVVGDFVYLMGLPPKGCGALDLKTQIYLMTNSNSLIYPQDERWEEWIEDQFMGQTRMISRYALKKDEHCFDVEQLKQYVAQIPKGIRIKRIDDRLYHQVLREAWSRDLCANFEDMKHFEASGFGYVAVKGREIVAGCSAYGASEGMMEIEVDTRKDYRRQGLALACSAAFLLECLEREIIPNWDAANLKSVGLAEKLGYIYDQEYQVYQLRQLEEE